MEHGDDPSISDDEIVLRRVHESFVVLDENVHRKRPSTLAFKQGGADGLVSVYLNVETRPDAVVVEGPEPFLASIRVGALRELGLGVVRDPDSGGPGHCVITGRKTKGTLNRIVQAAAWVEGYAPE